MTIEILAQRLSAALALSGGFLVAVAVACWLTVGNGSSNVIRSIHDVGGLILASLGRMQKGSLSLPGRQPRQRPIISKRSRQQTEVRARSARTRTNAR
jgi:hypothetical protein